MGLEWGLDGDLTSSVWLAWRGTRDLARSSSSESRSLVAMRRDSVKKCGSFLLLQAKPKATRPTWKERVDDVCAVAAPRPCFPVTILHKLVSPAWDSRDPVPQARASAP